MSINESQSLKIFDFAPGDNAVILRNNFRNFYAPQLFYKSPFYDEIVPVRIKDINHSADLIKIYGPSAANGIVNQNIILLNNYPIRYVEITARIIGQFKRTFESNYRSDLEEKEPIYHCYLCDTSGSIIVCIIPEHKFIGAGLLTKEGANDGILIKIIGFVKHYMNNYSKNRQLELHPIQIDILTKKNNKSLLIEIEQWQKAIDFRDNYLKKPWILDLKSIEEEQQIQEEEFFFDINNLRFDNNVLVTKKIKKNNKRLKITSFQYDFPNDDILTDSILINKKNINHKDVESENDDFNVEETNEDYEKPRVDIPATGECIISTEEEDHENSDIEEIKEIPSNTVDKILSVAPPKIKEEILTEKIINSSEELINFTNNEYKPKFHLVTRENVEELLLTKNLITVLIDNPSFTKSLIFDEYNQINKITYIVEFFSLFIGANKSKELKDNFTVDLKKIYRNLKISNFLVLLVLKFHWITLFIDKKQPNNYDFLLKIFDKNIKANELPNFEEFLLKIASEKIIELLNSKNLNSFKSKIFHKVREELNEKSFIKGFKVLTKDGKNVILINFEKINFFYKIILKEIKKFIKDSYNYYFKKLTDFGNLVLENEILNKTKKILIIERMTLQKALDFYFKNFGNKLSSSYILRCIETSFENKLEFTIIGKLSIKNDEINKDSNNSKIDGMIYIIDRFVEYILKESIIREYENELIENFFKRISLTTDDYKNNSNKLFDLINQRSKILKKEMNFKKLIWKFENECWTLTL